MNTYNTLASTARYTAHALRLYSPPAAVNEGLRLLADLANSVDSIHDAKRAVQTMNDATAQMGMAATATLRRALGGESINGVPVLVAGEA